LFKTLKKNLFKNNSLVFKGSSAPEILLSIIEIFGNNFEAGDLGPRFNCFLLYKKIYYFLNYIFYF
jgi:hypothetical protein